MLVETCTSYTKCTREVSCVIYTFKRYLKQRLFSRSPSAPNVKEFEDMPWGIHMARMVPDHFIFADKHDDGRTNIAVGLKPMSGEGSSLLSSSLTNSNLIVDKALE